MTASSGVTSHSDLNRTDENRGKITEEESDVLVSENCIDRQTHIPYRGGHGECSTTIKPLFTRDNSSHPYP